MNSVLSDGVRVKIFGREYEMDPGTLTPLEVESLARFVDERMRDVAEKTGLVDTQKIAVLTAVNIALDYLQSHGHPNSLDNGQQEKLDDLSALLDHALKS